MNRSGSLSETPRAVARSRAAALLAGALLVPCAALAHDYWLQADQLVLAPGERLTVHLNLGQSFQAEEEKGWEAARAERFELRVGRDDVRDLLSMTAEGAKRIYEWAMNDLPDGTFVRPRDRESAFLLWRGRLHHWTPGKYDGSVVNWVNGPLLAHVGRRMGFDVTFEDFRHRAGGHIVTMTAQPRD